MKRQVLPFAVSRRRPRAALAAVLVAAGLAGPALAQNAVTDPQALYDRLLRLERQIQDMQGVVYQPGGGGGAAQLAPGADLEASAAARLSLRIDQLETMMRELNGQVERLRFEVQQTNQRLENVQGDMDFRLRDLEGTGGGVPPQASSAPAQQPAQQLAPTQSASSSPDFGETPGGMGTLGSVSQKAAEDMASRAPVLTPPGSSGQQTTQATPVSLPEGDPQGAYDTAMSYLRRGDYAGAEAAFQKFLDTYGDTNLAGNAQYWLGETYYVREQYQDAARAFLTGYQTYADSPKAPDSLLKLGITLAALGQKQDACITLSEVGRTFPNAPQSVKLRADQERARAGCV